MFIIVKLEIICFSVPLCILRVLKLIKTSTKISEDLFFF